jgi:glycosyltransferase involved in cell wall biosynthesis
MKVFYVISNACEVAGGAERAARTALRQLSEQYAFVCEMLSAHPVAFERTDDGIRLRGFRDVEELKTIVVAERPDVIIASLADAVPAFRVARRFGIPSILWIHSYEFSPPTDKERRQWSMPTVHRALPEEEIDFVLKSADHVFTCSQHMQEFLRDRAHQDSEVLLNAWDKDEVLIGERTIDDATCIAAICGYRHKGSGIFLELARRFPGERFMLVGELGNDLPISTVREAAALSNVNLTGRMRPRDFLARSKLVLVPSQWPEPFGRIAVEALANAIPVLASRTGGLREIIGDGAMGVDDYGNIEVWQSLLSAAVAGPLIPPAELQAGCARARRIMATEPVHLLGRRIRSLASAAPEGISPTVTFSGGIGGVEAFKMDNAAWAEELTDRGYIVRSIEGDRYGVHDHVLLHDYLRDFNYFQPPDTGHCIAVRTSDFGPYPKSWAKKIEAEFDHLWVYSKWIAEQAQASGIDPAMIRVVPLGFDANIFRPDGPISPLVPRDRFTFLFVGGAVRRKGIDILIKAYQSAFSATDKVALLIKGDSKNKIYEGRSEVAPILHADDRADAPLLLHIDQHFSVEDLAALFRGCDVGVFPYRAEGFAKPILEAMASGMPSIVPNLGPAMDYCSPATSFLVSARRIRLPFSRKINLAMGFEMDAEAYDFCEVRVDALARTMREAFEAGRVALTGKQQAGIKFARDKLNWTSSADHVEANLRALGDTVPRRIVVQRKTAEKKYRREAAARQMLIKAAITRKSL